VAARSVPANTSNALPLSVNTQLSPSSTPCAAGWSSLLSSLSGEPDDEDHERWLEGLFGSEQRTPGCISPPCSTPSYGACYACPSSAGTVQQSQQHFASLCDSQSAGSKGLRTNAIAAAATVAVGAGKDVLPNAESALDGSGTGSGLGSGALWGLQPKAPLLAVGNASSLAAMINRRTPAPVLPNQQLGASTRPSASGTTSCTDAPPVTAFAVARAAVGGTMQSAGDEATERKAKDAGVLFRAPHPPMEQVPPPPNDRAPPQPGQQKQPLLEQPMVAAVCVSTPGAPIMAVPNPVQWQLNNKPMLTVARPGQQRSQPIPIPLMPQMQVVQNGQIMVPPTTSPQVVQSQHMGSSHIGTLLLQKGGESGVDAIHTNAQSMQLVRMPKGQPLNPMQMQTMMQHQIRQMQMQAQMQVRMRLQRQQIQRMQLQIPQLMEQQQQQANVDVAATPLLPDAGGGAAASGGAATSDGAAASSSGALVVPIAETTGALSSAPDVEAVATVIEGTSVDAATVAAAKAAATAATVAASAVAAHATSLARSSLSCANLTPDGGIALDPLLQRSSGASSCSGRQVSAPVPAPAPALAPAPGPVPVALPCLQQRMPTAPGLPGQLARYPMATVSGVSPASCSVAIPTGAGADGFAFGGKIAPSSGDLAMVEGLSELSEQRKVRHNLAERRRTNRINKLFNQLYEVLISPEVLPILNEGAPSGQLRKLPRKSKAAVLEAAIHCIETLQRRVAENEARKRGEAVRAAGEAASAAATVTATAASNNVTDSSEDANVLVTGSSSGTSLCTAPAVTAAAQVGSATESARTTATTATIATEASNGGHSSGGHSSNSDSHAAATTTPVLASMKSSGDRMSGNSSSALPVISLIANGTGGQVGEPTTFGNAMMLMPDGQMFQWVPIANKRTS